MLYIRPVPQDASATERLARNAAFLPVRSREAPGRGVGISAPPGWECLETRVIGGPPEQPLRVDAVLLHPEHGIVLVDLAPRVTPDAAEMLRANLAARRLRAWPAAEIPILYLRVTAEEGRDLLPLLRAALAERPPRHRRRGGRRLREVRAALRVLDRDAVLPPMGRVAGSAAFVGLLVAAGLGAVHLGLVPNPWPEGGRAARGPALAAPVIVPPPPSPGPAASPAPAPPLPGGAGHLLPVALPVPPPIPPGPAAAPAVPLPAEPLAVARPVLVPPPARPGPPARATVPARRRAAPARRGAAP